MPKTQRSSTKTLRDWLAQCASREEALRRAHTESGLTMASMAAELGTTSARVGQLIARAERVVEELEQRVLSCDHQAHELGVETPEPKTLVRSAALQSGRFFARPYATELDKADF